MIIQELENFIRQALDEDIRTGDITSLACIRPESRSKAKLLVKEEGVLAGVDFAEMVFKLVDPSIKFEKHLADGTFIKYGDVAFHIEGNTRDLLKTERLVLNVMQRMSGIATLAARFAAEVAGLPVKILDTRKTTPLNRALEKWAVRIGGCYNYRDGLYDWFMIKDNHIKACGSPTKAIRAVQKYQSLHGLESFGITVEVKNLVECEEVMKCGGVTRIMLDNFDLELLREAVALVNKRFETEASGGISLETIRKVAHTGVDFISVGALTHSAGSLDLSLKIQDQLI
ncbi:MAG TPA: carboxylating nicotinate-nucleotide diphosphorylase [Saprospiraceae bacterium]|nr:carboxylating nicotinate-nucleotide diphosphorylase [Candidatus Vicinibacter affinis]HQX43679.1 carboxylating nicotinate-nucleotide diphosphorylase [Saprospiraceae bacterium]